MPRRRGTEDPPRAGPRPTPRGRGACQISRFKANQPPKTARQAKAKNGRSPENEGADPPVWGILMTVRPTTLVPRPRVVLVALALALAGTGIAPVRANPVNEATLQASTPADNRPVESLQAALMRVAPSLDNRVLSLALQAHWHAWHRGLLPNPRILTVIDYSLPSTMPRFWVFDLSTRTLLFEEQVAHGKNSGGEYATRFSNDMSSL